MSSLDNAFAALADPTRRAIVARLASGEAAVGELAAPFRISLPAISRHLRVLEEAGLISRERRAQQRICRLNPAALNMAGEWLETHRRFWEQNLDRLETHLNELQEKENAMPHVFELEIVRVLNAPRKRVWAAWTDFNHARNWMGPPGHPMKSMQSDFRVGGTWRNVMRHEGKEMPQGGVYREIREPELLAFTFAWEEEGGTRGPETLVTVRLDDLGGGKTKLTLTQGPFATASTCDGHRAGWNRALDAFEQFVAVGR